MAHECLKRTPFRARFDRLRYRACNSAPPTGTASPLPQSTPFLAATAPLNWYGTYSTRDVGKKGDPNSTLVNCAGYGGLSNGRASNGRTFYGSGGAYRSCGLAIISPSGFPKSASGTSYRIYPRFRHDAKSGDHICLCHAKRLSSHPESLLTVSKSVVRARGRGGAVGAARWLGTFWAHLQRPEAVDRRFTPRVAFEDRERHQSRTLLCA